MRLDLEVVLRDEDGNDKMGSSRGDYSFEQDSIFLPEEWEPDVWGRGGDRWCS